MLRTIFKPTIATSVFIVFGALLFAIGVVIGFRKDPLEVEKILYPFVLSLIPIGAGYLNYVINARIEEESRRLIQENDKRCEERTKSYVTQCLDTLEKIQMKLPPEVSSESREELRKSESKLQEYIDDYEATTVLAKFLGENAFRRGLLNTIIIFTEKAYKLDKVLSASEYILFQEDLGRCLNWIRYSVERVVPLPIDEKQYFTRVLVKRPGRRKSSLFDKSAEHEIHCDFCIYECALKEGITYYLNHDNEDTFRQFCTEEGVPETHVRRILEEYIDTLVERIRP